MIRFLGSFAAATAIVAALWWLGAAAGLELSLVPTLAVALLLTTALHLALNRPRWRS